ncbi:MAG: imelysin family protein, partial [Pseudohongiellaceae bacterium]
MADHLTTRLTAAFCVLAMTLAACSEQPGKTPISGNISGDYEIQLRAHLTSLVAQQTRLLQINADALESTVSRFLEEPTDSTRETLQQAWLDTHNTFAATRLFAQLVPAKDLLFRIDAWPIAPGFIDSLPLY